MRLLVTRPQPDGERTAAQLRALGHDVMLAPLMRIEAIDADLGGGPWHALAFTSANAVRAIAAHPRLASLLDIPAYAVGGRTADAIHALGFDNVISADGDAHDLVRVIKMHLRSGTKLLHLAGEDRAGDLAGALAAAGIDVRTSVVYRMTAAKAYPSDVRNAIAGRRIDGVLHFSRRSAGIYIACAKAAGILDQALAPAHYCLSQQVAEPLRSAGAGRIGTARKPTEAELIGLAAS